MNGLRQTFSSLYNGNAVKKFSFILLAPGACGI
jgi:hypothetical protein